MAAAKRRRLPSIRFLLTLLVVVVVAIALANHARHRDTGRNSGPGGVTPSGSPVRS